MTTGTGGETAATGPTEVTINGQPIKVTSTQTHPKYDSREQFIALFAKEAFCWTGADTTKDAIDGFNKAFRNAAVAWNLLPDDYRKALLKDNADYGKVNLKKFN